MKRTRRSPNVSRAASATARWARWIGSNVPPKTPVAPSQPVVRHASSQGCRLPFELGATDPDEVTGRRRRPAAARRRCPSARGLAGTVRPIPRCRSSVCDAIRSMRLPRTRNAPSSSRSMTKPSGIDSMRWTTTPAGSGGDSSASASGRSSSATSPRNASSPSPVAAAIRRRPCPRRGAPWRRRPRLAGPPGGRTC